MKYLILGLINIYQIFLSPVLVGLIGQACRFNPTCSQFAKEKINSHGIYKGGAMALKRLMRCHPRALPSFGQIAK